MTEPTRIRADASPSGQASDPVVANAARVALVTGGATRVGRAIVERLAAAGFDVAFTYFRNKAGARATAEAVAQAGRKTAAICADLTSGAEAATEIHRSFIDAFDRLDVLVNNASIYDKGTLADVTPGQIQRLFAIHVEAPVLLCQQFAPHLRRSRGHVLMITDVLAARPWTDYMIYCASKAALSNLTLSLASELAPQVTVNAIAPGVVAWPDGASEDYKNAYLQRIALGRAGEPGDVAALVHFLCTTGDYITGQLIAVDGGYMIK